MITSISNDLIKLVRSLHYKKGRLLENLFLAEGIHLVQEGLKAGSQFKQFFWSEKLVKTEEGRDLLAKLSAKCQGLEVSEPVMEKICETENPQGIVATIGIPPQTELSDFTNFKLGLVVDGLQDPGNVGAIIRTAWAAGCDGLFFTPGAADPFQGKVVRASMGGVFNQRICQNLGPDTISEWSNRMGIRIIAGDPRATDYCFNSNLSIPALILIGNEGRGLDPQWAGISIHKVLIPQPGGAESLNASISAGILLYEALRQRLT